MRRALIVTDSLGLPRLSPETVELEDTYIYKLRRAFPETEFFTLSMGGADIATLYGQINGYYQNVHPDIVVIQSGIVDCAPRTFLLHEQALLRKYLIGKGILRLTAPHKDRIRKFRKITYTPPAAFRSMAEKILQKFSVPVYWIGIAPAVDGYEQKLPGITKNIEVYNAILKEACGARFLDVADFGPEDLMSDYHHLSRAGHQKIFDRLQPCFQPVIKTLDSEHARGQPAS